MRLAENKIKEAILDPNLEVRQQALRYFSKSNSTDLSLMPLVIRSVEMFGRENAYTLIGLARDLPQSEETIAWIIDELNGDQCDQHENYAFNLSMVLVKADPLLLLPRETAILESRHFLPDLSAPFGQRLQMLAWDEATCWRKLEEFCEEGKDKRYVNDIDLEYGFRIVEALARHGAGCQDKVHALLSQTIEDYRDHPLKWMEPFAARLAGAARLDSAIPLLIAKLAEDGDDVTNEECAEALVRIGNSAVLEAVAAAYPNASHHFRLYAINPLECIHSDLAVEKCLQLLRQESDDGIRLYLVHALLSQFAEEGIEEARKLLAEREFDVESRGLRIDLMQTCAIMGKQFPEFEAWQAAEEAEQAEHQKRLEELEGDPTGLILFALEKLTGKKMELPGIKRPTPTPMSYQTLLDAAPPAPRSSQMLLATKPENKQRVGRNDPCPCRSGKKFKQCCLRKMGG